MDSLKVRASRSLMQGMNQDSLLEDEKRLFCATSEVVNRKGCRPTISMEVCLRARARLKKDNIAEPDLVVAEMIMALSFGTVMEVAHFLPKSRIMSLGWTMRRRGVG